MSDIFGDLREWGQVLKQIEQLGLAGHLDEHQEGLTRVLRYRYNWQLRQAALRAVRDLRKPSKDLLGVLLDIVADEYCDLETRVLACETVLNLIRSHREQERTDDFESDVFERAGELLRAPQPPVIRAAVKRWLALKREPAEQPTGA